MSPSDEITTIEMSPNLEVSTGGQIGKVSDELQGVTTGRDIGKSRKRRTEPGRCRSADGDELSAEQALGQALSRSGNGGLKHGSAGRESNRKKPKKFRERVLRLVRKKYSGEEGERFGPTLAAEHLASDDDLEVNAQTLRRWMLAEGLWSRARKRRLHRKWRGRKETVGEMVQMDGSFHNWLEERGPRGCLMNMVD